MKAYRLNGVVSVVRSELSANNRICLKPYVASSFVNTFDPFSVARVWSTAGRICHSLCTHLLRRVSSTHSRIFPSWGLGATTMLAHHGVG